MDCYCTHYTCPKKEIIYTFYKFHYILVLDYLLLNSFFYASIGLPLSIRNLLDGEILAWLFHVKPVVASPGLVSQVCAHGDVTQQI